MPRPKSPASVRTRLLDLGAEYLLRCGYHGTGLKEVLDAAGVPKGSFYNHFPSKEAYAVAIIDHAATALATRLTGLAERSQDPLGDLRDLFGARSREFAREGCRGGCLIGNLAAELDDSEACRSALRQALASWTAPLARLVARGQELGQVRGDLDATELAAAFLDAWEGAYLRAKLEQDAGALDRCISLYLDGLWRA